MSKIIAFIFASISIIFCGTLITAHDKNKQITDFLESYGWEVKKNPIEKAEVQIPEEFDEVYEKYNELQLSAGLNLSEYRKKKGIRYTYEVTNYPIETESTVRANVIVIDNIPVAGDIMTTNINGFMHSLNKKINPTKTVYEGHVSYLY